MPERVNDGRVVLEPHQKMLFLKIDGDSFKSDCPVHGENVYFERVKGNLFQCAHYSHKPIEQQQRPHDVIPGKPNQL